MPPQRGGRGARPSVKYYREVCFNKVAALLCHPFILSVIFSHSICESDHIFYQVWEDDFRHSQIS